MKKLEGPMICIGLILALSQTRAGGPSWVNLVGLGLILGGMGRRRVFGDRSSDAPDFGSYKCSQSIVDQIGAEGNN